MLGIIMWGIYARAIAESIGSEIASKRPDLVAETDQPTRREKIFGVIWEVLSFALPAITITAGVVVLALILRIIISS
jgi:hypothetical protein